MNTYVRLIMAVVLFATTWQARGQAQGAVYVPDTSFKVYAYNRERTMGFSGGLNNPQFSLADLNNDGKQDLIVYEKSSNQIKTFINYGTPGNPDYQYRAQYEQNFPQENGISLVSTYLKVQEINCDSSPIPDMITRGMGGFSVYYGYYDNDELKFNYYKDLYYTPLESNSEGFESVNFPSGNSWKAQSGWSRQSVGANPYTLPQQGSGMVRFNSNNLSAGTTSLLISKRFRASYNLKSEGKISFWIYRDDNLAAIGDSISLYINSDTTLQNAVYISRIARSRNISQPDTKPANGWYQYTFPIPLSVTGNSLYFIFKGTSRGGYNIYLDKVSWISSNIFGDINAYAEPSTDIPAVVDIDGDGDLDFLAFNISGGLINFYKNYQVEEGLHCDSIHINLKDACWGKISQGYTPLQVLGINCSAAQPPVPPSKTTHNGNNLCFFDADGDGDVDFLNGGVGYSTIQYLENGKADYNHFRDTIISQDTAWSGSFNNHTYQQHQFPAAFYLDIDQDGANDIVITPSAGSGSENYNCVSFYKNTGTNANPVFTYQHDSLLVDQMIDMGSVSYPMIYDYNKDGKPDLFIGSEGFFQQDGTLRARIAYYQNTSMPNAPSFTLIDNDFLGIDALNINGAFPAVGDLDNDGKDDLVIGHSDGSLSFYKNMAASAGIPPQWQLNMMVMKDDANAAINVGMNAAPFIYDLNQDGKNDLIIGSFTGWLSYYENTGTANQLALQLTTSMLGDVKVDDFTSLNNYSAPFIGPLDNTGVTYLLVGSNSGRLSRYKGLENGNVSIPYTREDSAYANINFSLGLYSGFKSVPAIADLDGDGKYEMILGNELGGVKIYRQVLTVSEVADVERRKDKVIIYPNPAKDMLYLNWSKDFSMGAKVEVRIFSMTGQLLKTTYFSDSAMNGSIAIADLNAGIYLVECGTPHKKWYNKMVVLK